MLRAHVFPRAMLPLPHYQSWWGRWPAEEEWIEGLVGSLAHMHPLNFTSFQQNIAQFEYSFGSLQLIRMRESIVSDSNLQRCSYYKRRNLMLSVCSPIHWMRVRCLSKKSCKLIEKLITFQVVLSCCILLRLLMGDEINENKKEN